jgi:hypothetical protein
LTTNRLAQFDEAILSRIHLTLKYDVLNKTIKEKIWTQLINRSPTAQGPAKIAPKELDDLVRNQLNGRQV